jgi:hypothetical protein
MIIICYNKKNKLYQTEFNTIRITKITSTPITLYSLPLSGRGGEIDIDPNLQEKDRNRVRGHLFGHSGDY